MADYSFTTQNVEDEIVKRLGQDPTNTVLDDDNENRVMPLFWTSVTDMILVGDFKEEDIAGLIETVKCTISSDTGKVCSILLTTYITEKKLLRYYDCYSIPADDTYVQKIIKEKPMSFIKTLLGNDTRNSGELYLYRIGNTLYFFKDTEDDITGKYLQVIYVKSPDPSTSADSTNLLSTYSLGFIYKAIDLTVAKIKQEQQ